MSPQASYLFVDEIVPRIQAVVARSVKLVGCEDVEEVTQDAIAMAARMLDKVERSGKQGVRACSIAYYCLQHIKSGRRSVGNSVVDVLATGTQLHGKCVVESLNEVEPHDYGDDDGNFSLAEMLSRDSEDPATVGVRELDWERFLKTQDDRSQEIVSLMAEGRRISEVAKQCGVSSFTVNERKRKLAEDAREFFGENILTEIARVPEWKCNLMATRERHASRSGH